MRGIELEHDRLKESEESAWLVAHRELSRLAAQRAGIDAEEGRWLLAARREAVHVHLGFGSFVEYAERSFGYKPRTTLEKLRVAEALEELPVLKQSLERGTVHWSAVRELTRVAVPETEQEWITAAQGKSLRQLEELVAGKHPGDGPSCPSDPALRKHVLRFEVAPETYALFREAMISLRRESGASLDDDDLLFELARRALGGPGDPGKSSYQIALSVCERCGHGAQLAGGEAVPVGEDVIAMAQCDAQLLGEIGAPTTASPANDGAHVGTPPRAKQTIPPARRRTASLRDQRRCQVPGCRHATWTDLHHVHPRADGGADATSNLITVCGPHHRAAHRGELRIEQTPTGITFRHADASDYGHVRSPAAADAYAKTFSALRNLGFRETEVCTVLAQLQREARFTDAATDPLLRAALDRLTPRRRAAM